VPVLKNVKHEKFAQLCATGLSRAEAYRKAAGARAGKNSDANSDDWLNARGVRKRIQQLQERNAERSEMTREEALQWLADLIRTPIGSVGKDSPLVQAYEEDSEGNVKVRLADKIAGFQTLCRMTGWNEPEKIRVSGGDSLSAYLLELRSQPISGLPVPDSAKPVSKPMLPLTFDIRRPNPESNDEESH
jgi:Terminase small subunit